MDQADAHQTRASRFLRGARVTALVGGVIAIAGVVLIWNADLYTARDRWEHIKLALYGEWQAKHWCPPSRTAKECEGINEFEAAFRNVEKFNVFNSTPIEGTGLSVTTGVEFTTANDVLTASPARYWCYISYGSGVISSRLDLGVQEGPSTPAYADLGDIPPESLARLGLGTERLVLLARSHCQFGTLPLTDEQELANVN